MTNKYVTRQNIVHCLVVVCGFTLFYCVLFGQSLFTDFLIVTGESLELGLPAYYSDHALWSFNIFSGFPTLADPQSQTFYPVSRLLSLLPNSWDLYIISAYILGSCFAYGYIFSLTSSRFAGVISGLIFGMCGYLTVRIAHHAILHTSIWLPLIIWSVHKYREKCDAKWFVLGSFAIAMSVLAAHAQITVYILYFTVLYVICYGWGARFRLRF